MMNPICALRDYVAAKYHDASIELISPLRPDGIWSLDVDLADKHLTVEWSESRGFGFSTVADENFGESADETLRLLDDAQRRADQLLTSSEKTTPPLPLLLSRLRERQGLTQLELASRLGVRQATISGLEHRRDIQLSTLRRVLEALGGRLEVLAVFAEARYRIDPSSDQHCEIDPNSKRSQDVEAPARKKEPDQICSVDRARKIRFISLERHNLIERSSLIARSVRERQSIFADCA